MTYKVRYHPRKKQLVIDAYLDNGSKVATYIEDEPSIELIELMEYATNEFIKDYLKKSLNYYVKN